jgi:hypothetical protein
VVRQAQLFGLQEISSTLLAQLQIGAGGAVHHSRVRLVIGNTFPRGDWQKEAVHCSASCDVIQLQMSMLCHAYLCVADVEVSIGLRGEASDHLATRELHLQSVEKKT